MQFPLVIIVHEVWADFKMPVALWKLYIVLLKYASTDNIWRSKKVCYSAIKDTYHLGNNAIKVMKYINNLFFK